MEQRDAWGYARTTRVAQQCIYQSINQFSSYLAAREPDSK